MIDLVLKMSGKTEFGMGACQGKDEEVGSEIELHFESS
jgi:hypothetical protein